MKIYSGDIEQPPCKGVIPIGGVMHTDLVGDLETGPVVGDISSGGVI